MPDGFTDDVDAVVVGAGPNGLVAATMLADAGWDVLVLDAAERPGGAVRTAELTLPGYHHDVFSSFYPLGVGSPILTGLGLERHGLRWRHAPAVLAHVLPDGRAALLSRDPDRTAESVSAFAPADGDAWQAQFALWQRVRDDLLDALLRPFPPVRPAAGLARELGAGDLLRFARMLATPAARFGEETFAGAGARLLVSGNALHTDLGPGQSGGAAFGWLLAMLGQDVGFAVPEGGAGRLADALVSRLAAAGGRVECGRGVAQVVLGGGRALGVRDEHGRFVRARRAVVAAVPAPTLYLDLVGAEHLPARLRADLARFQWDAATIKVDWALSRPIPWADPRVGGAGTVHLGVDEDGLVSMSADLERRAPPRDPFLILGQMTTADPTRSPPGTEAAWTYTHVPRGDRWDRDRLERKADQLQRVVEQHAPGFTATIRARSVAGPDELESANPSLVGGAVNGGTAAVHQQLVFRPVPGMGRAETPVPRLYLAGSSAHPGGGVHGACGANAARAALAAAHPVRGPVHRAAVRMANRALYGAG